jgi:hypothetical protein
VAPDLVRFVVWSRAVAGGRLCGSGGRRARAPRVVRGDAMDPVSLVADTRMSAGGCDASFATALVVAERCIAGGVV